MQQILHRGNGRSSYLSKHVQSMVLPNGQGFDQRSSLWSGPPTKQGLVWAWNATFLPFPSAPPSHPTAIEIFEGNPFTRNGTITAIENMKQQQSEKTAIEISIVVCCTLQFFGLDQRLAGNVLPFSHVRHAALPRERKFSVSYARHSSSIPPSPPFFTKPLHVIKWFLQNFPAIGQPAKISNSENMFIS